MKIRALAALVCVALCAPLAAVAAESGIESMTMMGYDALSGRNWAKSEFFVRMEELTGVPFTFRQYEDADAYDKAKTDALAGNAMPDVFFKAGLTPQETLRYAETGALIDLAPLLEEHAPNLWALLQAHPDWREAITLPDGKIVVLPAVAGFADQVCLWINQEWLAALGLEVPDSPESLRVALEAFRDGDPNRNGRKDEIPLYVIGPWEARWLMPFFGLVANDYGLYVDEAGTVRFAPFQPAFAEFLAYLRDLNETGLLGAEAFRGVHALLEQEEQEASAPRIGAMISILPTAWVKAEFSDRYVAVLPADGVWRDLLGPVWTGTFAITSACPDPAAALRWVDVLYTEEGAILATAGKEGVDYETNEQGKWNFLVHEYRSIDSLRAEALMDAAGDALPGIRATEFLMAVDYPLQLHVSEQNQKVARAARLPVPLCYVDEETQAEIGALQEVLGALLDTGVARFALGETPLDAEHLAAFEQSLRDAGAERLTELWQDAVDGRK